MENFIQDILSDSSKLIFIAVLFVAITEFLVGFMWYLNTKKFIKTAKKTDADVRSIETMQNNNSKYDVIVVSFKDQLGNEHTSKRLSTKHNKYKIGDKAEVLYSKDNPDKVKLNNSLVLHRIPLMLMIAGPFGLVIILTMLTFQGIASMPF